MNIDTARSFLSEHGLRMTLSTDGGRAWYIVRTHEGEVLAEATSYLLGVHRARTALRKRANGS